jgi:hypothetical protein
MEYGESNRCESQAQMSAIGRTGFMTRVAAVLAVVVGLAVFGPVGPATGGLLSLGKPDFELTGRVYDEATKEPIEGAYVVALYYERISGPAALTQRCKRTKGMYTSKDGTFHFAVEKLDGLNPAVVTAIKPGYFSLWEILPPDDVWKKQGKEAYSGRDLPLQKQDPQKPSWQLGAVDVYCTGAEWREDVEAAIEFLKLELSEEQRLGARKQGLDALRRMIEELQSRPVRKGGK